LQTTKRAKVRGIFHPQRAFPPQGTYSTVKDTDTLNAVGAESEQCVNGNWELPLEECWLYKISKSKSSGPPIIPVSKWLRDVFDQPDSPFSQSRRNLLTRLEVILAAGGPTAAYRFGGSVPSLNLNYSQPTSAFDQQSAINGSSGIHTGYNAFHQHVGGIPSTGSSESLSTGAHGQIEYAPVLAGTHANALTFNRIRRPKYSLPPQRSGSQRLVATPSSSTSHLSQSLGGGQINRVWSGSTGKIGSCDALETIKTDVQEIARIQEDNLKAEVAALAAAAAGRHGSQHSLGSYGRRSIDGSLTQLTSAPGSPSASTTQLTTVIQMKKDSSFDEMTAVNHTPPGAYQTAGSSGIFLPNGSASTLQSQVNGPGPSHAFNPQNSLDFSDNHPYGPPPSRFASYPNGVRTPYSILPQRPSLPPPYEASAVGGSLTAPTVHSQSGIPNTMPAEPRTHFGFRPSRKVSTPSFPNRPPLPAELRRVSATNLNPTNACVGLLLLFSDVTCSFSADSMSDIDVQQFIDTCRSLFGPALEGSTPQEPVNYIRDQLDVDRIREDLARLKREVGVLEANCEHARQALIDAGIPLP
ncbi:Tat pathway signal sequence domain protein, partial [Opisthorchis viverrini]